MNKQVVVIGGGPAGLAAAVKLQNFGLNVVLIDKQKLADI
ncbi:FAD-dependent oxidoreductase [Planktothricoides sp. SR001]|nr:FAD-dependent oxidoreductase [Planktothricoides sp. SR001]